MNDNLLSSSLSLFAERLEICCGTNATLRVKFEEEKIITKIEIFGLQTEVIIVCDSFFRKPISIICCLLLFNRRLAKLVN